MYLRIEIAGENEPTLCDCCGNKTKTVWGYVYEGDNAIAAYFVQWTQNNKEHFPNFDFLIGTWGDESIQDKKLISWVYNATHEGEGSYMVIDAVNRPAAQSDLCSKALKREEAVTNCHLMKISKEILDAVWLNDSRIEEIKNFGKEA